LKSENLKSGLDQLMIPYDEELIGSFQVYHQLLESWNNNMNLTSVTAWDMAVSRHYLDSASLVMSEQFSNVCHRVGTSLIDIGTGPGLPGIVLKLLFPELRITLLEASAKKSVFLKEVCDVLSLTDITIVSERAEIQAHVEGYRESFDLVVSRAVAKLNVLAEYCLPLSSIGGNMIAMKGRRVDKELTEAKSAVKKLGGEITEVVNCSTKISGMEGRLVVIKKVKSTPDFYPRRAGVPKKRPIT